jgi:hypothetical protein
MKELRAHLQEMHRSQAEHHTEVARSMNTLADQHHALSKHLELTDPTGSASHKAAAEACKVNANCHVAAAEKCLAMHKSAGEIPDSPGGPTEKVEAGELQVLVSRLAKLLGGELEPTRVSPNPLSPAPRQKIVPRYGQNDPDAALNKVDVSLRHLVHDDTEEVAQ